MSIVLFTGAGASVPFGYPTTTEFFNKEPTLKFNESEQTIFTTLKEELDAKGQGDLEVVLEHLDSNLNHFDSEHGKFFLKISNSEKQNVLMEQIRDKLRKKCFQVYGQTPDSNLVDKIFCDLIKDCLDLRDDIQLFTTNYDPITDVILEKFILDYGKEVYDGFNRVNNAWDKTGYDKQPNSIKIYRLHGSINWVEGNDGRVRKLPVNDPGPSPYRKNIIIYPGYKGDIENAPEIFRDPHHALRESLSKAKILVIIGYSFRDENINKIFKERSAEKRERIPVLIVNPDPPEERIGEILKEARFHKRGFGDDNATLINWIRDKFGR